MVFFLAPVWRVLRVFSGLSLPRSGLRSYVGLVLFYVKHVMVCLNNIQSGHVDALRVDQGGRGAVR